MSRIFWPQYIGTSAMIGSAMGCGRPIYNPPSGFDCRKSLYTHEISRTTTSRLVFQMHHDVIIYIHPRCIQGRRVDVADVRENQKM